MCAFVVDPSHIDVLLSVAINGPSDRPDDCSWEGVLIGNGEQLLSKEEVDEAGASLLANCITAVRHLNEGTDVAELPEPRPMPDPNQYEWTDLGSALTAIEGLRALRCYELQCNQHPLWLYCGSSVFCNQLRGWLISVLPGYEAARWHWDAQAVIDRLGPAKTEIDLEDLGR